MSKNTVAEKMYNLFKNNQFHVGYTTMPGYPEPSEKDLDNCVDKLEKVLSNLSKRDMTDYIDAFYDNRVHEKYTMNDALLSIGSAILNQFADFEAKDKCFSEQVRVSAAFYMKIGQRVSCVRLSKLA